jgi:hypothetical protein
VAQERKAVGWLNAERTMTNGRLLCLCLILFSSTSVAAQTNNSDRCQVAVLDLTGKNAEDIRSVSPLELGAFDTVVYEGEVTTRAFRLPGTKLFIVASVSYDDETLATEKGADSVSFELTISTRRKRDVQRSLVFAHAEMPLNGFDVGRVSTMVRAGGRKQLVIMECRVHKR